MSALKKSPKLGQQRNKVADSGRVKRLRRLVEVWGPHAQLLSSSGDTLWDAAGPLPFEQQQRYTLRLIRERLTREMLLGYLQALVIMVDDRCAFGDESRLDAAALCPLAHGPPPPPVP
jgi:hypothetical protein